MVHCSVIRGGLPGLVLLWLSSAALGQTTVPFSGSGTSHTTKALIGDCLDRVWYKGRGHEATLGRLRVAGRERVDSCGGYPDIEGHVRFKTGPGDRLTLHYVGIQVGATTYLCQVVRTRGAGRFAGAQVDAMLLIDNYSGSRPFDFTLDGTITYP
jgi:hypothetical protein